MRPMVYLIGVSETPVRREVITLSVGKEKLKEMADRFVRETVGLLVEDNVPTEYITEFLWQVSATAQSLGQEVAGA
jgi:hypothetical protein